MRQRRLARVVIAALVIACGIAAPLAAIPLPRVDAFIPIFVNDFITSVLLFAQFSIIRSRALLALAGGYLFTALVVIADGLTFPGAFSPTGLLGAGPQSSPWLYLSWHISFPLALSTYALLKDGEPSNYPIRGSTRSAISWTAALVLGLVCGLTLLATAGNQFLPRLFVDATHQSTLAHYVFAFALLLFTLALALLWTRRRSVLDQWLMVVVCAAISDLLMVAVFSSARFTLGFYTAPLFSVATSVIVLAVLLVETTKLYAQLALANMSLQREQNNKLMSLEAMVASISHEVKQPLTAIAMRSGAASRFLRLTPPDLERVQSNLDAITRDSHRASQVFDDLRALYGRADQGQEPIDVNEIARGVLNILQNELREHGVITQAELTPELPTVMGHRGQLQEVLLNLVCNAIDAIDTIEDGRRVLRVTTERQDRDTIIVSVADTGPGIDPKRLDNIFEAFVTTKPHGMGLGLAICRMIIQRHGSQLSAWSSEKKRGALFQFTLPIKPAAATR